MKWFDTTLKNDIDMYEQVRDHVETVVQIKQKVEVILKLADLLMDVYTLGRMLKMMTTYSSKNLIVYAGGYHVETYRDFFNKNLGLNCVIAPKKGPRCLDLTNLNIELTPVM
jgi:hypothetical protein